MRLHLLRLVQSVSNVPHLQVSVPPAVPGAQGHEGGPRGVAGPGDEPQVCRDRQSDARLGNPQECQSGSFEQEEIIE